MKARDLDKKFDEGKSILKYFDVGKVKKSDQVLKRVNVDFPVWIVNSLDKEASKLGISRQAVIKIIISEKLKHNAA